LAGGIYNAYAFTPREYVTKYGGATRLIDMPDGDVLGILLSREYNGLDLIRYNYGLANKQEELIKETFDKPLTKVVTKLDLPFYFVMGKYDGMTSLNVAKSYYEKIDGDKKGFISFERSAHYPQFEEKEKFYEWMCDTLIK